MARIDLQKLVERLDPTCRRALEAAAGAALSRSHFNVEIEHWLAQLVFDEKTDIGQAIRGLGLDRTGIIASIDAALDRMQTGNGRAPSLAPDLVATTQAAWLIGSVEFGTEAVRSGHLLAAWLEDEAVGLRLRGEVPAFRPLLGEAVRRDLARLVGGSAEEDETSRAAGTPSAATGVPASGGAALDRFTTDLTAKARAGEIDPVLGRDAEIRQVIDILSRRRQNNPILTGEAGVGKTAIVEGLALKIAEGDVPPLLARVSIRSLDLGLLQAGAGVKGEFENRLRAVLDEVRASPDPVILFIDETHTLIGAGNAAGSGDAANLLKPPLARGELRSIGATTWAEYKKHIEKDAALARRFQAVKVGEPEEADAIGMVRGLVPMLESHHGVRILDEAAVAAVRLSRRYIPDRHLPDKAVSLIDTACARVAMSQNATPPAIEGRRRRLAAIEAERRMLAREARVDDVHAERLAALAAEEGAAKKLLAEDESRFAAERRLVAALHEARDAAEAASDTEDRRPALRARAVAEELGARQGETPMVHAAVDAQAVAAIVESWTGIPAGRMRADEVSLVLSLEDRLRGRVVGQEHALRAVAEAIRISRAGLTDPRKPVGVFLMVGTSGVGKTETATALADILYGGAQSLTTINMTEFKEEHKVSLLMGSPPGYVGYGEGGVLTEAVRRRPHSVLLLDEIEKAHPGVQDVFFQVFDKGTMKDGEGRDVDFRDTIVIMTTNACSELISQLFADPETAPDAAGLTEALREALQQHFKPAFLGRVTITPYLPLDDAHLGRILELRLARLADAVLARYDARLVVSERVREMLIDRAAIAHTGARSIENRINALLSPALSAYFLKSLGDNHRVGDIELDLGPDGAVVATPRRTGARHEN